MNIFAGHVNFQNHMPDGLVNQMLTVKPWYTRSNSQLPLLWPWHPLPEADPPWPHWGPYILQVSQDLVEQKLVMGYVWFENKCFVSHISFVTFICDKLWWIIHDTVWWWYDENWLRETWGLVPDLVFLNLIFEYQNIYNTPMAHMVITHHVFQKL